jgi:hypothetical protein
MQLGNAGDIDPSLVGTYLELAALNGDAPLYDKYLDRITRTRHGVQAEYRQALPYFTDPGLRKRTEEYAMSPEVRTQDSPHLVSGLLARPWSSHGAWEYVKQNWDSIQRSLGVFQGLPQIAGGTNSFCDQPTRDDVQRFFDAHPIRAIDRQVRQALETIDRCIATKKEQRQNVSLFFKPSV